MKKPIKTKTYRVFVTRHYIAVDWMDVVATSPGRARSRAEAVARKIRPDARAEATDNGWIGDEPVEVPRPGARNKGTHKMTEIRKGVFRCED